MFNEWFVFGTLIPCLLLGFGHYFPWPGDGLGTLLSYVYGVASLLLGLRCCIPFVG